MSDFTESAIEEEIKSVSSSLGHFPSRGDLSAMGAAPLCNAIMNSGGFSHWQKKTGINPRMVSRKWNDAEIERQLREIAGELGHFPSDPDRFKCATAGAERHSDTRINSTAPAVGTTDLLCHYSQ